MFIINEKMASRTNKQGIAKKRHNKLNKQVELEVVEDSTIQKEN